MIEHRTNLHLHDNDDGEKSTNTTTPRKGTKLSDHLLVFNERDVTLSCYLKSDLWQVRRLHPISLLFTVYMT